MPPVSALRTNTAMVPMNHAAATGHRWRELHIATRTVAGSRRLFVVSVMAAHSPPSVVAVLDYLVASVTWVAPSALRSVTIPPFCSTVAGVWSAVRNAVSWSMTGCSHAFRVVESGPIVTLSPSSVYEPL